MADDSPTDLLQQMGTPVLEQLEDQAKRELERRAGDQEAAMAAAFIDGALPEIGRRAEDAELAPIDVDVAGEVAAPDPAAVLALPTTDRAQVAGVVQPNGELAPVLVVDPEARVSVLELTHEVDGQRVTSTAAGTFVRC